MNGKEQRGTTPPMNKLRLIYLRDLELMATSTLFRRRTWNSVVAGPLLLILCIMGLVVVNEPSNGGFLKNWGANLVLGVGVVFLTAATLFFGKLLRDYYRSK
jgi:uncharacterized membrane protein